MIEVRQISRSDAKPWILNKHYARRMPSVSFAYGLFDNNDLVGVITYGSPASPFLCKGVCGETYRSRVIELNRLIIDQGKPSMLIGQSLKRLPKPKIIVSYADTAWSHVGYVYQATNFLFTGTTKKRTDMLAGDGKHSRHNKGDSTKRQIRSAKHRYVCFVGSKTEKKIMKNALNYPILPYPKGDIQHYKIELDFDKNPNVLCYKKYTQMDFGI